MDIFGVGPLELILILIFGLIVFGPERLPEVGRFLGRQLAKVMAWQQQSPEAQMIQQMRQEFEQEIVGLRDELLRTRQQLDISQDVKQLQADAKALTDLKSDLKPAAGTAPSGTVARSATTSAGVAPAEPAATAPATPATTAVESATTTPATVAPTPEPEVDPGPIGRRPGPAAAAKTPLPAGSKPVTSGSTNGVHEPVLNGVYTDRLLAGQELLLMQIQALMVDLHAIQQQLREAGVIAADWQPPSHLIHPEPASQHETVSS